MSPKLNEFYTPERFKGRTGLQIFVDRFCRVGKSPKPMEGRILKDWNDPVPNWRPEADGEYYNNYFYGGNLQGIISKLDYIESMGFNLLYLSPLSYTQSSHHYDVEDQRMIDPWIGTWEDFKELCEKAHKRDILISVDLVFNHMGINSIFFQAALHNKSSPYYEWFEWDDEGKPIGWYGFKDMPQCNKLNLSYQEYTFEVTEKYIRGGADAVRLDLGENFPESYMNNFRRRVKKINPEILIVIEMWDLATKKENPQLDGKQTDSVMNYPLSDCIIRWIRYGNAQHFVYTVEKIREYPNEVQNVLWNFLDSHDTPRVVNMLTGEGMLEDPFRGRIWDIEQLLPNFTTFSFREWEEKHDNIDMQLAKELLKIASTIQYFFPGIPIVYAGTEMGITGYKDPFNRKPCDWENPDQELQEHYRRLGRIRKENRKFFSYVLKLEYIVSETKLEIIREACLEKMVLEVKRDIHDPRKGTVELYQRIY